MNPLDKRLAVRVGDHPLDYLLWEGIIPQGQYGAGPVVVWDTGIYRVLEGTDLRGQLARGKVTFELEGERLRGGFTLALMKRSKTGRDWLLIKKKDPFARLSWKLKTQLTPEKVASLEVRVPPCQTD
jgi:DNA ligase D-like protein (predicted 3'-phosphoesterase)